MLVWCALWNSLGERWRCVLLFFYGNLHSRIGKHAYDCKTLESKAWSFEMPVFPSLKSSLPLLKSVCLLLISIVLINKGLWELHFGTNDWSGTLIIILAFAPFCWGFSGLLFWFVSQ